jgi:zinc protease
MPKTLRPTFALALVLGSLLALGCTGAPAAHQAGSDSPAAVQTAQAAPGARAGAAPQATPEPPPDMGGLDLSATLPTHSELTIGKLDNGLTYYIRPYRKPEDRTELWLVVNAGSVLEEEDQRGMAHFIEHMAFNGTRRFAEQELVRYLEGIGMQFGADINAWTGFDETVYTLRVPTDKPEILEKGFEMLEDWAQGITFDPKEIDKERGVIVEEWRLGRGADARMRDRQFPIMFQGSRYAERLPIGQREVIEKGTREAMQRFYHDWYRPDLMAVIAVGDFDRAKIEQMVKDHFGGLKNPSPERPRESFTVPPHQETLFAIATDPEATETHVAVYHKLPKPSEAHIGDYRQTLVETLYHNMLNARLEEQTQTDDPPYHWGASGSDDLVRTASVTYEAAEVPEGGAVRGLEALLTEIERVRRYGFSPPELDRAKAEVLRSYERALAEADKLDSSTFASEYVRNFLEGEPAPGIPYEQQLVAKLVPGIRLSEVNALAGQWTSGENRVISVSAPSEGAKVPSKEELLAVYKDVERRQVKRYVDRAVAGPLVPQPPRPGTIAEERTIPELGVTEWRLSNGARVVLKPTPFQNDQILLSGFSPGGLSLVSDKAYLSGSLAASIVRQSGVGRFDRLSLEKALAGKAADLTSYIGETEEGVRGVASPRDAETLFQLAYLNLTQPRADKDLFGLFLGGMEAYLQRRQAEPEAVFQDRLAQALAHGNPRGEPLTLARLREVDLQTAQLIYRERFADAADFTFVLVGNFTPEEIKPLVLTYLASLPSHGGRERPRDTAVEPPPGVTRVEVDKGIEPRSRVQILFNSDAEFSREAMHDVNALASALEIRLREVLREEMGSVYGVAVQGDLEGRPHPRASFTVQFACAPERVDELVKTVFDEIAAIRERGLDETYLQRVRETERRQLEVNLKENSYWLAALQFYYSEGFDPLGILREGELTGRVSADRLREVARATLDPDRYVLGVLNPESKAKATAAAKPGQ